MDLRESIYLIAALLSILASALAIWEFLVRRAPTHASAALPALSWQFLFQSTLAVAVLLGVGFLILLAHSVPRMPADSGSITEAPVTCGNRCPPPTP